MGSSILDGKTLVTLHALVDLGLFNSPLADKSPFLVSLVGTLEVLLSMRGLPSLLPVVGELLKERCLKLSGLFSVKN